MTVSLIFIGEACILGQIKLAIYTIHFKYSLNSFKNFINRIYSLKKKSSRRNTCFIIINVLNGFTYGFYWKIRLIWILKSFSSQILWSLSFYWRGMNQYPLSLYLDYDQDSNISSLISLHSLSSLCNFSLLKLKKHDLIA